MPQRATEERFHISRPVKTHVCPKCGEHGKAQEMWVPVAMTCDNCGTEMRPTHVECPICLDEVASKDLYSHKCTVDY